MVVQLQICCLISNYSFELERYGNEKTLFQFCSKNHVLFTYIFVFKSSDR